VIGAPFAAGRYHAYRMLLVVVESARGALGALGAAAGTTLTYGDQALWPALLCVVARKR